MQTISWRDPNSNGKADYSYPELKDMPHLLSKDAIKIKTVNYKADVILRGFQLVFTESAQTPLIET